MNDEKFLQYITENKDRFYSFLKQNLYNPAMKEDVFLDAVLTAYKEKDKFIEGTNFKAWFYKILLNKCFCANRDISFYWEPIENYTETLVSPNRIWNNNGNGKIDIDNFLQQCSDEVYQAFMNLSLLQRLCIYLKDVEDLPYKDIASVIGIPQASVMTHLSRGRTKLRMLLADKIHQIAPSRYPDGHKSKTAIKNYGDG
ncbi:MAG TPA: RNA polymerase sigma factor [Candidatus Hydrogenedens sp.]|nr:RNA polymerase sigma factor [Candidatus Hydrogenedens sp.]